MGKDGVATAELQAVADRFLSLLQPDWINSLQAHADTAVYTPLVTVTLMILQRLRGNASLEQAVAEGLGMGILPSLSQGGERTMSSNTGAFSRARARLEVEAAEQVCDRVFERLVAATPPSFAARRVFTIDGTTFTLSSEEGLREVYPPASNQHGESPWPIMQAAVAHELSSGCALRPEIGAMHGPERVSEVDLAIQLLSRIPAESIVMADRDFGIFYFTQAVHAAGLQLVARLTEKRFRALERNAKKIAEGRWEWDWKPSPWDRKHHPDLPADASLPVHLHEIDALDAEGKPMKLWLVTTLTEVEADRQAWSELSCGRWRAENDIRDVKIALQMEDLRGRSDPMLRKELAWGMAAYNLVVQIRRLAAKEAGVEPRRLSFKGTWSLVLALLLTPNHWSPEEYARRFEVLLRAVAQRKLPHRPHRHYPRTQLSWAMKYPTRPQKKKGKSDV
jgi:Transposase DDE domain